MSGFDYSDMADQFDSICAYVGKLVVFTTIGGQSETRSFSAIFNDARYDSELGEVALDGSVPTIEAPARNFAGVVRGDFCTIGDDQYSIIRLDSDGHDGIVAILAYESSN